MQKNLLLAAGLGIALMSACQSGTKPSDTDSTTTFNPANDTNMIATTPGTVYADYYEAELPAASGPGRIIGLSLRATGDATLTTDYQNYQPEIVQVGPYEQGADSTVKLTLTTVGSGNDKKETFTFKREGEVLVYQGKDFGSDGLKLTKKEKQVPEEKELILWVNKKKTQCTVPPGGPRDCYQISYDKVAPSADKNWQPFSNEIEGFTFQEGKVQHIKVQRRSVVAPPADASPYTYKLLEVLSK